MEVIQQSQQDGFIIQEEESGLDIKKITYAFLRNWIWFLLSTFVCLLMAFLYLRYSTPVYKIHGKVLIKDDKNSQSIDPQDLLSELNIFNSVNNVDNEKEVLQTYFMFKKVVDELNLNVNYFAIGNIKSSELYKNSPFNVNVIYLKDSLPKQTFDLNYSNDRSSFTINSDSLNSRFKYYDTIKTKDVVFVISPTSIPPNETLSYQFTISDVSIAAQDYLKKISFNVTDKQASVIEIELQETVPRKGEDFINKLYEIYTRINQEDKNKIADSTINFIDNRLAVVSSELSGVEKNIEQFKVKNQLSTDLNDQVKLALTNVSDVQKQLTDQDVQISVVQSLEDHLKSGNSKVVPNAGVIQDPTYISTVQEYNNLVLERERQLETTKPDNPIIQNLNSQINALKTNLLVSLENIKKQMQIARNELAGKNSELLGYIESGPGKERVFQDISREQEVKQQLYLYLLQKREETAISKSGTLSNSRLIEPAKSDNLPFTPKRSLIYLVGLLAGIIIPSVVLYLQSLFNNKVNSRDEVTRLTDVSVLGEIGHNETGKPIVAEQNSRTAIAEQFRAIRTNLQFLLKGKNNQVIMVTSSVSGEGKSFFTTNLGSSLAISGKKTLLIELDLRKPKISREIGLSIENGFTDYVIGKKKKEEIIKSSNIHPNLFLISSGIIPPNPAELLLDEKVNELFDWLRKEFDYIIVDTPPSGVVIDAVLIAKHADASIYIVRQGYTLKDHLNIVTNFQQQEKFPNVSIIINDIRFNTTYGYKYGYHYGYGYSSDYYTDEKKKRFTFLSKRK